MVGACLSDICCRLCQGLPRIWSGAARLFGALATLVVMASAACASPCDLSDTIIIRKLNYPRTVEIQLDATIPSTDTLSAAIVDMLKRLGKIDYSSRAGMYRILPDAYDAGVVSPRVDLNYDFLGVRIKLLTATVGQIRRKTETEIEASINYSFLAYFTNVDKLDAANVAARFHLPSSQRAILVPASCTVRLVH